MWHTLRVVRTLGPFVLSFLRDQRRWLWWGAPLERTPAFHDRRARRLVAAITALGPTFVKLAQVFAARADLIEEPYLGQLGTLVDAVAPVPWPAISRELEAAYGAGPDGPFTAIDHTPLAAASLGQVHRAQWQGRDVVVKVLRPGIEAVVALDVASARAITRWAARQWPVPHVQGLAAMVDEFAERVAEELDFRQEAAYATEVRTNFAGEADVVIPEVMASLTRQRVLVLEYVPGRRVDRLDPATVDARRLATAVMTTYVQMMLIDGLFHADPHPGNLLVDGQGRLVLLDFGMMVRVPTAMRLTLVRTVFASVRRSVPDVAAGFHALGLVAPGADPREIERLAGVMITMADTVSTTRDRLETILTDRIMTTLHDFPVLLPRELVYFARTAALIEGLGTRYDPYFNAIAVGTPLVLRMRTRILRSLGDQAAPSVEEVAAIAGWAAGTAVVRARGLANGMRAAARALFAS
jgi:predicted unusual protein kinase regulating ubiquinone biosynthesis (AarF/ABC1/UbiB family)